MKVTFYSNIRRRLCMFNSKKIDKLTRMYGEALREIKRLEARVTVLENNQNNSLIRNEDDAIASPKKSATPISNLPKKSSSWNRTSNNYQDNYTNNVILQSALISSSCEDSSSNSRSSNSDSHSSYSSSNSSYSSSSSWD